MKIAFDAKRFFQNTSGLGNYSRDLVRILACRFPHDHFFLLNKKSSHRGKEIVDLPNVSFEKTPSGKFSRQLQMGKTAQNVGADIFHGLSGELPLKWNRKPIRKMVTIHDLIFVRFPEYYTFFDRNIHLWKFRKAAQKADLVIAISEQTKTDIINFLKIDSAKIKVIYQGCHSAFQQPTLPEFSAETKNKFNLPARFILNVGTVEERKNLGNLVQALYETDIPLVVIGKKTKYFRKIEKKITKLKLKEQIVFLEGVNMEELAAIYKMSDFLVYPSYFEGFGIPIIEALFSGIPVITSNRSSLPEAGGKGALYINPSDPRDIRAKIEMLWNNKAERDRLAGLGWAHVQQFTDEEIAQRLHIAYSELLAK